MACNTRNMAICIALSDEEVAALEAIVTHQTFTPGQSVFFEGDPADHVYNITGGMLRLSKLLSDGRRQITGFLLPGDFLGFIRGDNYSFAAEAVTQANLCRFSLGDFMDLLDRFPKLEKRLLERASNELAEAQDQMLLLGRKSPKEKLASFLVRMAERQARALGPSKELRLAMGRNDIADYLGLTIETVSRCFTQLRKDKILALPESNIVIVKDGTRLRALHQPG